jgi:hypothetical protein
MQTCPHQCRPTPQEVWDRRTSVTFDQRQTFLQCVERMQTDVRIEPGCAQDTLLGRPERAIVARAAACRAPEALDYLEVRRRRIVVGSGRLGGVGLDANIEDC